MRGTSTQRRVQRRVLGALGALVVGLIGSLPAGAGLIGDRIGCEASGLLVCDDSMAEVTDAATEFAIASGDEPVLSIDVRETSILLQGAGGADPLSSGAALALRGLDWASPEQEALVGCGAFFSDNAICEGAGGVLGLPSIASVVVVGGGTGLTGADVTIASPTSLEIDLAGTVWEDGLSAALELEFVPEPAASLFVVSVLAVAALRRPQI